MMLRRTAGLAAVLAIAVTGVALAASAATYNGTTSQHLPIKVTVKGFKVVRVSFTAKYGACGELSGNNKVSIKIFGTGFKSTVKPNSETKLTISGTFGGSKTGKTLKGKLSSVVTEGGIHPTTCSTGAVTYTAALK
jgi:hypothetical protein